MAQPTPTPFDRTGELVRRAQELADTEGDQPTAGLDVADLVEVARDLDVPVGALAQALAESQARLRTGDSIIDRLIGPAEVAALRRSRVPADVARLRAERWLVDAHGLKTRVDAQGVVIAARRRDIVGVVRRGLKEAGGVGGLGRSRQVRIAVADVDENADPAVCVVADVSDVRRGAIALGAASGTALGATGYVGLILAGVVAPVGLAVVPVAAGVGVGVARIHHRRRLRYLDHAVERTADGVSRGERPPTLVGKLTNRLAERIEQPAMPSGEPGRPSAPPKVPPPPVAQPPAPAPPVSSPRGLKRRRAR